MKALGSRKSAASTRRRMMLPDGFSFQRSDWMSTGNGAVQSPTIFLVEQPAGSLLRPHFHRNNQFQVVVEGSGRIGRHEVKAGSVHYAGAYTGYGPVVAGPEGLSYFTIRSAFEIGALFVEESRHLLPAGPRYQTYGQAPEIAAEVVGNEVVVRPCIARQDDDLDAIAVDVPADVTYLPPSPAAAGQFLLVLQGAIQVGSSLLERWESAYADASEPGQIITASIDAKVLVLQMPALHRCYRGMPAG